MQLLQNFYAERENEISFTVTTALCFEDKLTHIQ